VIAGRRWRAAHRAAGVRGRLLAFAAGRRCSCAAMAARAMSSKPSLSGRRQPSTARADPGSAACSASWGCGSGRRWVPTKHCPEHCRRCAPPGLAPDEGVGVLAFYERVQERDNLAHGRDAAAARRPDRRPDRRHRPTYRSTRRSGDDLCGWYNPRAQRTDMQAWSVLGAGVQVLVRQVSRAAVIAESRRFQFQMAVTYRDGPMELFSCWLQSR